MPVSLYTTSLPSLTRLKTAMFCSGATSVVSLLPSSVPGVHGSGWQDSSSGGFSALLVRCHGPWCHLAVCERGPAAGCPDGYRAQRYESHLQTGLLPQPGWRYSQRPVSSWNDTRAPESQQAVLCFISVILGSFWAVKLSINFKIYLKAT